MNGALKWRAQQNSEKLLPAKRIQVLSLRMVKESSTIFYPNRFIRSPKDAADLFRQFIGDSDREQFCIMCLNTKNEPTALHTVSIGTLNASLVHPRETFKLALLANAASIVACHNHPSGEPTPSPEDVELTERLKDSGTLLGIELLDHIILGDGTFVSMKERGLM
ncbi:MULTISPECIES: DNA repair protein RadC [unclassified Paenibacillus]|uniref:JAB domain-containing protein n=1 Tax=unclassified Paenibacillus TaxID=185978 RepID=UPI001AE43F6E|nr:MULTISPECIES: DNA repair protein RadC [unclassified Paenibacillus]MBP1157685.1 DNA repair protein RadC [Paenibacillus sp. PvP091]MBP1171578.1 DNA repair protein RadC [Paenibacillus sp. PvR098]MBP2437959.1 DNA repair protein RadC [Paenibacillus sp. PvP052]